MRSPAEDHAISVRNVAIGIGLLVALTIWTWIIGKDTRVVFFGAQPGAFNEGILVRTDPETNAIIARNDYASMRTGCRYDFNYAPKFGKGRHDYGYHVVRKVRLVDCP